MAQYFFRKYTIEEECTPYGEYEEVEWEMVQEPSYYASSIVITSKDYRFESYDGSFRIVGGERVWVDWNNRGDYHHYIKGGELYRELYEWVSDGRVRYTLFRRVVRYKKTGETCRDYRGRYVGTVTGTINEYPSNGIRGGYWYVRGGRDESPIVIYPAEGDIISHDTKFEWDTNIEYGSGTEGVWLQLSTDGGSTWVDLFRMGSSAYNQGYIVINVNKYGATSNAKLRIFAVVNGEMTTPNETGVFTIIPNSPPELTEPKNPYKDFYHLGEHVTIEWEFNDPDIPDGDYQTGARIELSVNRTGELVKEFEIKGESPYVSFPISDLDTITEYAVRVYPKDRLGMEPYRSLASRFTTLDFVPKVIFHNDGILNDKKVKIDISTNFKYGRSITYLYDSEGKLIEENYVGTYDTDVIFDTELENLKFYTIVMKGYMNGDTEYGAGLVGDFTFQFQVVLDPPPKPSLEYTVTEEGVELVPVLNHVPGEPFPVRSGLQKYVNGNWITLTDTFNGYYLDRFAISGTTQYRSIAYSEEGSASYSDPVFVDFELQYPMLTNLRTLETIRIEDVIKTDLTYKPDTQYHQVVSRNSLVAETGDFVRRELDLEWEIYDKHSLNRYKDFLWYDELYLYRDGEGRYLRISISDIKERETYNPHWYYLSLTAIEVAEV